jgi:hypothetical protein
MHPPETRDAPDQAAPAAQTVPRTDRRLLWLTLACAGALALFVNKAFNIDDPLFVWTARQIERHPLDFYGFTVNWYDEDQRMSDVMQNPPLASYYIALVAIPFGGVGEPIRHLEAILHLAFLLPALGVVWGTYRLAERFCTRPLLASLTALFTPVFLVSSSSVMCDTLMLCFWVWAVVWWDRGLTSGRAMPFVVAGCLIALSALTKYFGVSLIPLLLVYTIVSWKRGAGLTWICYAVGALAIPVAALVGYHLLTEHLYGHSLLFGAAKFAAQTRWQGRFTDPERWRVFSSTTLVALAFTGGCVASAAFYLPLLWPRRYLLIGLVPTALLIGILSRTGYQGPAPPPDNSALGWHMLVQIGIWAAAGVALLLLAVADLRTHHDAPAWLLFLWVMGTFVFAAFLNWTINARSLLPLVPAAGILVMRRLDRWQGPAEEEPSRRDLAPLIPAAALALLVAAADFWWANSAREAAERSIKGASDARPPRALLFLGHWGFQYYMEEGAAEHMGSRRTTWMPGDLLIIPENSYIATRVPDRSFRPLVDLSPNSCVWLTTTRRPGGGEFAGAGFYSHLIGPLPFAAGRVPREQYHVLEYVGRSEPGRRTQGN